MPAEARGILPVAAVAITIAIFVVDTVTPLEGAVAVIYVVVVLIAANFLQRRGILIAAIGCSALTILSYLLSHGFDTNAALIRCLMSLSAIGITTFLALRNQSTNMVLREQARLLHLTHDTVFVRDMNDVITYWNRGAEALYGWKKEQAVGRVSHQLMQTVFPAPLEEIRAELLLTGRLEEELIHTKRDGTKAIVASRWSLQRDERGRPVATLETNNDITQHKQAEQALQQVQAELTHVARVTTLGELTASIAHEVNQPITAVITNAGAGLRWLAAEPPNLEEARQALNRIVKDSNRASAVVTRIRALIKKAPQRKDALNVNETILEVLALIRGEAHRNEVSLHTELSSNLPLVRADRIQVQQVMLNLIINAIEAMQGMSEGSRELTVGSARDGFNGVLLSVRDSGPGLDAKSSDHLFDAFYTTKPDGIGMGLAISRSIVEAHGGRLWATANVPRGAVFQFTLPADGETSAGVA